MDNLIPCLGSELVLRKVQHAKCQGRENRCKADEVSKTVLSRRISVLFTSIDHDTREPVYDSYLEANILTISFS